MSRVHVYRLTKYPINSSEITNVSDRIESVSQMSDEVVQGDFFTLPDRKVEISRYLLYRF